MSVVLYLYDNMRKVEQRGDAVPDGKHKFEFVAMLTLAIDTSENKHWNLNLVQKQSRRKSESVV